MNHKGVFLLKIREWIAWEPEIKNLSIDIATRLSRMLGTTITYWLNLQQAYDEKRAEFLSEKELKREREVFRMTDYKYFRDHFGLPDLPRQIDKQIECVREFLSIASLAVLEERNLSARFRNCPKDWSEENVVNANAMVQIAINEVLATDAPKYNKKRFEKAVSFVANQKQYRKEYISTIKAEFRVAGVILVILPNLKHSRINGATKKVDGKVLLMINDYRHTADSFRFALDSEIGYIQNGDLGISIKGENL